MGTVSTDRVITASMTIENHGNPGTFGLVSRDPTQPIYIDMFGPAGGERIEIIRVGDSTSFDLLNIEQVVISAAHYPTEALINFTNLDIELDSAPFVTFVSGPTQFSAHFDGTITSATTTTLWTPASGKRFVIMHAEISTDSAMRVALVDGTDVAGSRIMAPYLAANGGEVRDAPYSSKAINTLLRVVTGASGNVFVEVDGFEST